jgi:hypothetical protein
VARSASVIPPSQHHPRAITDAVLLVAMPALKALNVGTLACHALSVLAARSAAMDLATTR